MLIMNTKLYRITMRKIKSLMLVALTLIMGLSMTSCLNSNSSGSTWDGYGIFRVESSIMGYYFTDPLGNSYMPTAASLASMESSGFDISKADYANFYFKWAEDETEAEDKYDDTTTTHSFDIEILSIAGITEDEIFIAQTDEEMEANAPETAPIMTLSPSDGYSKSIPVLFDLDAVLLPIYFNIGDDSQEVFKKHKLVLACNMSEVESGSTELTLYLRHDKGTDDEKQYYTGNWYAFNLRSVIAEFTVKAGNIPTKLIIKAHEDLYQTGKMPEDYTTYEIEYKDPAQTSQN